jgi:hypothetical protein
MVKRYQVPRDQMPPLPNLLKLRSLTVKHMPNAILLVIFKTSLEPIPALLVNLTIPVSLVFSPFALVPVPFDVEVSPVPLFDVVHPLAHVELTGVVIH